MSLITNILPKKEIGNYFLILAVEGNLIQAAITLVSKNKVEVLGTGKSEYSSEKKVVEAADLAISEAEKKLPDEVLVEKVIFALPQHLIKNEKIESTSQRELKKIAKDLNLKPQGFVEYPTTISIFLEKEEGAPATFIFLEIVKNKLSLSLIRVGKIQQQITVERSKSLKSDFEKIIPELDAEVLPSRIIIYGNSDNIEKIREELLSISWHKHSTFLHTPKIEIFSPSKILKSVVEAAAGTFLKSFQTEEELSKEKANDEKKDDAGKMESKAKESFLEENNTDKKTSKKIEKTDESEDKFIPDESFGFVKTQSDEEKKDLIVSIKDKKRITKDFDETTHEDKERHITKKSSKRKTFPKIKTPFKVTKILSQALLRKNVLPYLGILIILTLLGIYLIYSYPKATVNLVVHPLISTEQTEVILTTNSDNIEKDSDIIIANTLSIEKSGEKTASTSGTSNIGEKAKGEVVIYNKTVKSKTFPKNTIIEANNLKFALDSEVSIASASDTGEGLTYGKKTATVTATSIGQSSNLKAGTTFEFKDFPSTSYAAKNSKDFSGGTSKEVSSVSQSDQEDLETSLTNELILKAKQELQNTLTNNERLLDSSVEKKIISKSFSKKIGEEAKQLTLKLKLKLNALSYNESDLANFAKNRIIEPPSGFILDNGKTGVKINNVELDEDDNYKVKATITTYFLPEIKTQEIKTQIAGKSYNDAVSLLKEINHIGGVKIVNDSLLPFLTQTIPYSHQNIQIKVVTF